MLYKAKGFAWKVDTMLEGDTNRKPCGVDRRGEFIAV